MEDTKKMAVPQNGHGNNNTCMCLLTETNGQTGHNIYLKVMAQSMGGGGGGWVEGGTV